MKMNSLGHSKRLRLVGTGGPKGPDLPLPPGDTNFLEGSTVKKISVPARNSFFHYGGTP